MIQAIRTWLEARQKARKLREAQASRDEAIRLQRDAKARNDDRDYGRATMLRRQATHECLRLELGR